MGYFAWFHLYRNHRHKNLYSFYTFTSDFSLNFRPFLRYAVKFSDIFLALFVSFLVPKATVLSPSIKTKSGLISVKVFSDLASQTKPSVEHSFWLIFQALLGLLTNQFLHWNREIETIVLSVITATNKFMKNWQTSAMVLKIILKNLNLEKNLTWLCQLGIHLGIQ